MAKTAPPRKAPARQREMPANPPTAPSKELLVFPNPAPQRDYRKDSRGQPFLITDGGLQHMLAASGNFGQLLRRNYPVAVATRYGAQAEEAVSVVGSLCTPLDILADQVELPHAEPGDLIAIFCAGAYGLTASPQAFLSQKAAQEMMV